MYGMAYMFVHDGLVHRRFPVGPIANVPYLQRVASAHQVINYTPPPPKKKKRCRNIAFQFFSFFHLLIVSLFLVGKIASSLGKI